MNKTLLITGAILGVLGIILGAFAAHGLEKLVDADAIKSFETGVRYQLYHAFFLLILGSTSFLSLKAKKTIFYLVLFGVIFFSVSIYGLATNSLSSFDFKTIAFITPLGGLLLIAAWMVMLIGIIRNKVD
ncbi:uncharacterized membrane protein YgdD (TMEM256/DUF423 family) [Winogradskyella eximia]|jgi:uncharacterized membrane protein YgdD (TMEM256/DUF423 family)|uniref:Uncharacterized membrane protein YgdD (TMEM256/DUF423 family) n=1 Tax=Winogradskyella eximia TaxID=262006 RepID=A0A3D9HAZ5_9FLAO|nr:DUF423 domain-containing protein [Winogradskyella eximia]RED46665.1 uncharacterized membrane protein YgdD (TMEM256/DUF423 family) [Winogradskyella eximia]|tara:strand:+ start:959 stop:1348 length:390 start_codon:yes stop_codon:yes gene_type:complete